MRARQATSPWDIILPYPGAGRARNGWRGRRPATASRDEQAWVEPRSGRAVEELQVDRQPVRHDQETTVAWSAHGALAPRHVGVRDPNLLAVHPTEESQAVAAAAAAPGFARKLARCHPIPPRV